MTISQLYDCFLACNGISTDTRQITEDCLFVALRGDKFDGNQYAKDALKKGSKYAIVDNSDFAVDNRYLLVDNSLEALQQLAHYHRKQLNIPIVGLTGSNGKTTTKELIAVVLNKKYKTYATKGNLNNHIGVPLTLLAIDKSYEIYLALYQGLSGTDEDANVYKQFSPDFFDLIVIDECHRGSAKDDSSWREILTYFQNATHIGLTATPKETDTASNSEYFGDPVYTYSLRQGIDDGFLAPYRVLRIALNVDAEGWRPEQGKTDKDGNEIEDRIYNRRDFDKNLVIEERTDTVAKKLTEFLKGYDRFAKTIVFCVDIDHAERMRTALAKQNADLVTENYKYVMQITGDNDEGKRELDNFINPEEKYPVIATTSELMTTGLDAQTCKVIVLDANINSMTKFKQIIGRGTRINEEYGKLYFTILDFRNATDLFADKDFDGDPIRVKPVSQDDDLSLVVIEEAENTVTVLDEATGEEIVFEKAKIRYPDGSTLGGNWVARDPEAKREKVYVNGVDVSVLVSREMYFDQHGKPITTSLKDHTKEIIKEKQIKDGVKKLLDNRGREVKDSLGRPIYVDNMKTIRAYIYESTQTKSVQVTAKIDYTKKFQLNIEKCRRCRR